MLGEGCIFRLAPETRGICMSYLHVATAAAVVLVAAACNSADQLPEPPVFTVSGTGFWAGSDLVISSSAFANADATVSLGDNLLESERIGGNTLAFRIPRTMGGTFRPSLTVNGETKELAEITVYGFAGTQQHQRVVDWYAQTLPGLPGAWMMVSSQSRVMVVDLETGAGINGPGVPLSGLREPGPTPDPAVWIFRDGGRQPFTRWRMGLVPILIDTLPPPIGQLNNLKAVAMFSDAFGLAFVGDFPTRYARQQDGSWTISGSLNPRFEGDLRMVRSPRGDRLTLLTSGGGYTGAEAYVLGIPVFDALTAGDTAFMVGSIRLASTVAFSPDGNELAIAGGLQGGSDWDWQVQLLDATGGTLRQKILIDTYARAIAYDRRRPFFYLLVPDQENDLMQLQVWHTETRELVAELEAACQRSGCSSEMALIASTTSDHLYAAESYGPFAVTRFQLPPPGVMP